MTGAGREEDIVTLPVSASAALPSRTAHVLESIKAAILDGEFEPGSALVEQELAARFGVSKTPVREALKTLEGSGLVTIRPYAGTAVAVVTATDAAAVYDLRLLLEPEAVRRAVAQGEVDLAAAGHALERAAAATDRSTRSMANRDFHRHLYCGCGNPLLVRTLDGLRDRAALVATASWAQRASWEHEAAEHAAILHAAGAGDAGAAAELTRDHISGFVTRNVQPAVEEVTEPEH